MSQETEVKRKKAKTAIFLLIMVIAIYLTVIYKQW
jgi:predicted nucleic acid-binding Zn ribbon protein